MHLTVPAEAPMRTAGELYGDRKTEDYRTENIDVELHVIEWPYEVVVESVPFDADLYRAHFGRTFGREERLEFHEVEPAYRFGHELRGIVTEREWPRVEPTARAIWEKSSPLTWKRIDAAIRHAWERAGG